ncbi:hypothetical protein WJX77_012360 [Trebouxia sp. C0004]
MHRIVRHLLQPSKAFIQSVTPDVQTVRVDSAPLRSYGQLVVDSANTARGGIASTSGRHAEGAWEGWFHLRRHSQPRIHVVQEQLGAAVANSVWCSPAGQKVLRLWPSLLVGNALTIQQSLCLLQPTTNPPYIQQAPLTQSGTVANFFAGVQEEFQTMLRACYLLLLFTPASLTAPFAVGLGLQRQRWLDLVVWTLERAGPAFIKWGQWAATRPDLFPPDLCSKLAQLQTGAPTHPFAYTRKAVEVAFGRTLEEMFDDFAQTPVASGSIAQIHKARLSAGGAHNSEFPQGTTVAVKVRHPGVTTLMQRDFTLMHRAARLSSHLPFLSELHLEESIRQFGAPLKEQLDLQVEAQHLDRFGKNFRTWRNLSFPAPVYPLVAPSVLVETFEEGRLISTYVDKPTNKYSIQLANIGLSCYLQMLLKDNFVHADLHPGNILVRLVDPNTRWGRIATFLKVNTAPKLVLLDVGMVAELTPEDQHNLVGFFKALTSQDGEALGQNILDFSEHQTCPNPKAFVKDMKTLFTGLQLESISEHTSEIIADMMEKIRMHQVNLKGVVSTVVVTTMVLEGWSSKLNPDIKIMDALKDILPMSWNERIARTVDKQVMSDAILGL